MSEELPRPVAAFLRDHVARRERVAYLGVDADGRVLVRGGDLKVHGIEDPEDATTLADVASYLEGALPAGRDPLNLESVETRPSHYADVHVFAGEEHDWVVLLDRTGEAQARQMTQQHRNELVLLRDRHAKTLDQYLGSRVGADLADGLLELSEEGERRVVTVMFADLRGTSGFAEIHPPEEVLETVSRYLRTMAQSILDEAGVVHTVVGSCVMAVFGLLPSPTPMTTHAVAAALRLIDEVARLAREHSQKGRPPLDASVSVATGAAVVGMTRSKRRRSLSVLGHPVKLAARLERVAGAGEIVADDATVSQLCPDDPRFVPRVVRVDETGDEIFAHVCTRNDP